MIKKITRVAAFLDGGNLYHHLKQMSVSQLTYYGYRQLCEHLAEERQLTGCGYYVGVVRAQPGDAKGQQLRKGQARLFAHLQSEAQQFVIKRGYIMRQGKEYFEKGVDVHIAVDMVAGAYRDEYDVALLMSSDTDLLPAVREVARLGKQVEYVGFSHRPSLGLQKHASQSRLLTAKDVNAFAAPTLL